MPDREDDDRSRGSDFDLHRGYSTPGAEHGDPREDPFGRGFEPHEPGMPLEHVHESEYTQPYDRWRPRDYVFYSGEGYQREFIEAFMAPGRYVGRGPKNYRRSDPRILEDLNDRLTAHPDIDATHIDVSVENGEVTLRGWVPDRNSRYLAEDVAWSTRGVSNVDNNLRTEQRVRQIPIGPGQRDRRSGSPGRQRDERGDVDTRGPAGHSGSGVVGSTKLSESTREASFRAEDADARRNRTP
jgi:hypothetical protein